MPHRSGRCPLVNRWIHPAAVMGLCERHTGAVRRYLRDYLHPQRPHSYNGYTTPVEVESLAE